MSFYNRFLCTFTYKLHYIGRKILWLLQMYTYCLNEDVLAYLRNNSKLQVNDINQPFLFATEYAASAGKRQGANAH